MVSGAIKHFQQNLCIFNGMAYQLIFLIGNKLVYLANYIS